MNQGFKELYDLLLLHEPQRSDVIIWPQGDRLDRAAAVLKCYESGLAETIALVGNNVLLGQETRPGEDNIGLKEMEEYLIKHGVPAEIIIIDDTAMNSKDQALSIIKLAKSKGWQSVVLANSAYHQPRFLLTCLKQIKLFNCKINISSCLIKMNLDEIPGGRTETVLSLLESESAKISIYKDDLVSIQEGIDYIKKCYENFHSSRQS